MATDDENERIEGVDFSGVEPLLDDANYPMTADEIVDEYGDRELERTNAEPITLRELFSYMGDTTFESFEDLQQMILGQMPRDSEGRTNYSDRGGDHPVETEEAEDADEQTAANVEEGKATDPDTRMEGAPGEDEDPDDTAEDDTTDTM